MGLPWPLVWTIVGLLAALLVGWLLGVLAYRHGIRSAAELSRQTLAERVVEKQEAQAERDVAQRGEAERATAGRDDTAKGGLSVDQTIAEIKRRIEAKKAELAPGDHRRIPRDDGGRQDPLASGEYERRKATIFGLDLALTIIDETTR